MFYTYANDLRKADTAELSNQQLYEAMQEVLEMYCNKLIPQEKCLCL